MSSNIDVICVQENAITPDLEKQIIDVQRASFSDVKRFENHRWLIKPGSNDLWFLAQKGKRVVGSVWLHHRTVAAQVGPLKIGGIGNVCSHPDVWGQGFARACLTKAQEYLSHSDQIEFGLLFAGRAESAFYEKLGWRRVENPIWNTAEGKKIKEATGVKMIYPARFPLAYWPEGEISLNGPGW